MLIVGGTWNLENGKKSGLIDKMYNLLKEHQIIIYVRTK